MEPEQALREDVPPPPCSLPAKLHLLPRGGSSVGHAGQTDGLAQGQPPARVLESPGATLGVTQLRRLCDPACGARGSPC